jgi:hypothetical protein
LIHGTLLGRHLDIRVMKDGLDIRVLKDGSLLNR